MYVIDAGIRPEWRTTLWHSGKLGQKTVAIKGVSAALLSTWVYEATPVLLLEQKSTWEVYLVKVSASLVFLCYQNFTLTWKTRTHRWLFLRLRWWIPVSVEVKIKVSISHQTCYLLECWGLYWLTYNKISLPPSLCHPYNSGDMCFPFNVGPNVIFNSFLIPVLASQTMRIKI